MQLGVFAGLGAIHFERRQDVAEHCRNLLPDRARICEPCHQPIGRQRVWQVN
jgi:hypothetical protein